MLQKSNMLAANIYTTMLVWMRALSWMIYCSVILCRHPAYIISSIHSRWKRQIQRCKIIDGEMMNIIQHSVFSYTCRGNGITLPKDSLNYYLSWCLIEYIIIYYAFGVNYKSLLKAYKEAKMKNRWSLELYLLQYDCVCCCW